MMGNASVDPPKFSTGWKHLQVQASAIAHTVWLFALPGHANLSIGKSPIVHRSLPVWSGL